MPKNTLPDGMLNLIISGLPVSLLLTNNQGQILFANPKIENLLGYQSNELLGLSVNKLIPPHLRRAHKANIADFMAAPTSRPMDAGRILPAVCKSGAEILVQIGLNPLAVGDESYVIVTLIETTNDVLKMASYNDPLTALPNRRLFDELTKSLRNLAIRNKTRLTLMFMDLDNFKQVNDQYGHDVGDQVLKKAAAIFSGNIRKNDVVGRIGGDEFLVCMYGINDAKHVKNAAEKLQHEISAVQNVKGFDIDIGLSIGAVTAISPAEVTLEEMIKIADQLMYKGKKRGKGLVLHTEI